MKTMIFLWWMCVCIDYVLPWGNNELETRVSIINNVLISHAEHKTVLWCSRESRGMLALITMYACLDLYFLLSLFLGIESIEHVTNKIRWKLFSIRLFMMYFYNEHFQCFTEGHKIREKLWKNLYCGFLSNFRKPDSSGRHFNDGQKKKCQCCCFKSLVPSRSNPEGTPEETRGRWPRVSFKTHSIFKMPHPLFALRNSTACHLTVRVLFVICSSLQCRSMSHCAASDELEAQRLPVS